MNSIRLALGKSQLTYYGFSYGTYLGQVYASMFPATVKRLIMDSNVDPRHVWYQANLDQDVAFNRTVNFWFGWLARYHRVYHLSPTLAAVRHRGGTDVPTVANACRHNETGLPARSWPGAPRDVTR